MTTQYERFFFWLGQIASGDPRNPNRYSRSEQYRTFEGPSLESGKIGKYQFTQLLLCACGYYTCNPLDISTSCRWRGRWTGKRGILSTIDFLSNKNSVQEYAIREAMRCHWRLIRKNNLDALIGTRIGKVLLTESSMLAASHFMGDDNVLNLAQKTNQANKVSFDTLATVAGFQTPFDLDPARDFRGKCFPLYLRGGKAIDLNDDLRDIPREEVETYVWQTQGDNKVRDSHAGKQGSTCNANDGDMPGVEPNCRCWAEWCIKDDFDPFAYNLDEAIRALNSRADALRAEQIRKGERNKFGEQKCAAYVRKAIEKGLRYVGGTTQALAKDFGKWLEANNFVQVAAWNGTGTLDRKGYVIGYTPKTGDVVVIQDTPAHSSGHVAMYNGTEWVSDFRQRDIWGGDTRKEQPDYVIYRL